ncbi:hypothetical protein PAAL109150_23605 [Paenibacillus alkaliterrae]|uniref:hypothetical protein n=1 Tax=Paenibacillus alkaliterrae TaxID=320909 RepID=UPI002E1AC468
MQALRYWDYYGMTDTFTDLYDRATNRESFPHLYDLITSRENILLTSNDNIKAIRFYQKRGFDIKAVHQNAITEARKIKPSIPLIGLKGYLFATKLNLNLSYNIKS